MTTRRINPVNGDERVVIEREPDDVCEICGRVAELRPYGPNGERVCFSCGMKDEAAARRQFGRQVLGEVG
ncbi:MAG: hypothetical protein AB7P99_04855 [Vicinamibacterales bacterium]